MSFPSDGTNHRAGIKNELDMTTLMGTNFAIKVFPKLKGKKFTSEHRGGTKYKEDAALLVEDSTEIKISHKNKKKTKTGTFDWVNSGKPLKELAEANKTLLNPLSQLKEQALLMKNKGVKKGDRDLLKKLEKKASNEVLNSLAEDHTSIKHLISYMVNGNKDIEVFVTTQDTNMLYHFPFSKHPIIDYLNDRTAKFFLEGNAGSSRKLRVRIGNETKATGIRIRLHLNNSVSPLLGISNTGQKSSDWVIKFQQDDFTEVQKIATAYQL